MFSPSKTGLSSCLGLHYILILNWCKTGHKHRSRNNWGWDISCIRLDQGCFCSAVMYFRCSCVYLPRSSANSFAQIMSLLALLVQRFYLESINIYNCCQSRQNKKKSRDEVSAFFLGLLPHFPSFLDFPG